MIPLTSKELIKRMFTSAELPRIPFIPLIFSHASRLEQIPLRRMLTDPGQLAKSLQNAQRLYGHDVIICPFDLSLEAEASGCEIKWENDHQFPSLSSHLSWEADIDGIDFSDLDQKGRMPVVLEAFRRLKIVVGKEVPIAAVIAGPLTLAERLSNSDIAMGFERNPQRMEKFVNFAARISLAVCKAFCEIEPDIIIIVDDQLQRLRPQYFSVAYSLFKPILNTIRFYNAYSILITKIDEEENLDAMLSLNVDGIILNTEKLDVFQLIRQLVGKASMSVGIAIPYEILTSSKDEITQFLGKCLEGGVNRGVFLTTEWEVPLEIEPEKIHQLMSCVSACGF